MLCGDVSFQQLEGKPWRDDEGYAERCDHGCRGSDGNGAHVGPHHPRDEGHREDGCDHRDGGQDGGVSHLVHALHRQLLWGALAFLQVAIDVFYHHDGVVHQDADGEDEGKQGDAVQRVAQQVVDKKRQRKRHGHGYQHHYGLAPAQEEQN